jgi:hypothetical protein
MIIQYACDSRIRDGSTTNTIPETAGADGNPTFGRHESYQYYTEQCKWRQRNRGLFIANRNLQGNGAIYTRQNENGARHGFECPEERDYYPYWHPTMWRDIAVFTNQPERCPAYQAASENTSARYYCKAPKDWIQYQASLGRTGFIPINATQCRAIRSIYEVDEFNQTIPGEWLYVSVASPTPCACPALPCPALPCPACAVVCAVLTTLARFLIAPFCRCRRRVLTPRTAPVTSTPATITWAISTTATRSASIGPSLRPSSLSAVCCVCATTSPPASTRRSASPPPTYVSPPTPPPPPPALSFSVSASLSIWSRT